MKLAELKQRLKPGTRLRQTKNLRGACDKLRIVERANTTGVRFTGDEIPEGHFSYLGWPKAKELRATVNGFEIAAVVGGEEQVVMAYQFEGPETGRADDDLCRLLDHLVRFEKAAEADAVNKQGLTAQLRYLLGLNLVVDAEGKLRSEELKELIPDKPRLHEAIDKLIAETDFS
jgi:hypothetical protein